MSQARLPHGGLRTVGDAGGARRDGAGPAYLTGTAKVVGSDTYRLDGDNDGVARDLRQWRLAARAASNFAPIDPVPACSIRQVAADRPRRERKPQKRHVANPARQ